MTPGRSRRRHPRGSVLVQAVTRASGITSFDGDLRLTPATASGGRLRAARRMPLSTARTAGPWTGRPPEHRSSSSWGEVADSLIASAGFLNDFRPSAADATSSRSAGNRPDSSAMIASFESKFGAPGRYTPVAEEFARLVDLTQVEETGYIGQRGWQSPNGRRTS